ncbi:unnamed protein product [Allacma fusca]|uniref:DUF4806 domain-containing protein n=1 Tax=Allacma fusca TaxID=39272 RepID=A0A8J2KL66_9HEXA|nr:unnamed protein product [Allacma fusca]
MNEYLNADEKVMSYNLMDYEEREDDSEQQAGEEDPTVYRNLISTRSALQHMEELKIWKLVLLEQRCYGSAFIGLSPTSANCWSTTIGPVLANFNKFWWCFTGTGVDPSNRNRHYDYKNGRKFADRASNSDEVELTENEVIDGDQRILRNKTVKKKYYIPPLIQINNSSDDQILSTSFSLGNSDETSCIEELNIFQSESTNCNILVDPVNEHSTTQNQTETTATADTINLNQGVPNLFVESTSKLDELLLEFQNFPKEFHNFEKVTLDKLVKLTKEVEHISRQVSRNSSHDESGLELPSGITFPMQAKKNSAILNNWLINSENQLRLVTYLKGIGGSDHKDCVRRILDRVFSGALRFESTVKPTEVEINHWIQKWFGGAGDRNRGRAATANKSSKEPPEIDSSEEDTASHD